jgi:hypothetical protein
MPVLLGDPSKSAQVSTRRHSCSFTAVAVDLTSAIPTLLPGLFVDTVAHGCVGRMAALITLPGIRVQDRAMPRNVHRDQGRVGPPVHVVAHPKTLLARLARQHTDDGWAIVCIRAVPLVLLRTPAGGISGVAMGRACFPRVLMPFVRLKGGAGYRWSARFRSGLAWMYCRSVWSCLRDRPHAGTRRAVGSPLAMPRSNRTGGRVLPGVLKDHLCHQGVGAIASRTPVGRKVALCVEQAPYRLPTVRASQAMRLEMTFQPHGANAIVHQLGDREINHAPMIVHPARWLT